MVDTPSPPRGASYVGNVISPSPGQCFRWVYGNGRNGYPTQCPEPVRWRGVVVNPRGQRIDVEACDDHVADLAENTRRATGDDR
jgi:hypothetical protein